MNTVLPRERPAATTQTNIDYEEIEVPVLVIGAGAAGARTAIALAEHNVDCLVVGKRDHGDAHTKWAAGGINAALGNLDDEDDWTIHAADTLDEGHFINNPDAVENVCETMPDRIRELDEWGCSFNRTDENDIDQRYFGAQSFRRTCFVGDRTGEAIFETLVGKAQDVGVPYRENIMITKLLSDGERTYGAVGYDMDDGHYILFRSHYTVLAAGGHAGLYSRHSSREDENTGNAVALAYDAGADLMDMEFIQFHPTGMADPPDWIGRLVTEAVRGEGGRLFNAKGERFMEEYSPDQMELDARDVVARAIEQEVREERGTENNGVYLDISHRSEEFLRDRLPTMYERYEQLDIDLSEEPIEVTPTAHYGMGGIDIDFETGATAVDRLHAVGEAAAGVHGANRLGGNSLAETVAIGKLVGDHIAAELNPLGTPPLPAEQAESATAHFDSLAALGEQDGTETPEELINELGDLLLEHARILRDGERIQTGIERLAELRNRAADLQISGDRTDNSFEFALDLQFMLVASEAILKGAAHRTELRGAHYRTDYTDTRPEWRQNILYSRDDGEMTLRTRAVDEPSQPVQRALDAEYELVYHHLE
jgi:succinate dehydrogenase / fumarate reductase flavoprotein subunit